MGELGVRFMQLWFYSADWNWSKLRNVRGDRGREKRRRKWEQRRTGTHVHAQNPNKIGWEPLSTWPTAIAKSAFTIRSGVCHLEVISFCDYLWTAMLVGSLLTSTDPEQAFHGNKQTSHQSADSKTRGRRRMWSGSKFCSFSGGKKFGGGGLYPPKPLFTAHGNEQLFHISYVHSLWNATNTALRQASRLLNLLIFHQSSWSLRSQWEKSKTTVPFSVWPSSEWTKGPRQPSLAIHSLKTSIQNVDKSWRWRAVIPALGGQAGRFWDWGQSGRHSETV